MRESQNPLVKQPRLLADAQKYVCEDCGYVGPIVMEIEKEENES